MIVMKFGGTSVQDAEAMRRVLSISHAYAGKKILMVSSACSGITSALLSLASDSVHIRDDERVQRIDEIVKRHLVISSELGLDDAVTSHIYDIGTYLHEICEGIALLGECTDRSLDAISTCGELFSTRILSGLLVKHHSVQWFDARKSLKTDGMHTKAQVDIEQTAMLANQHLKPLFLESDIIITQGFIGSDEKNATTTLGRGGSDYSAAIFGAVLQAEEIIIWTDVSGIASADPRVIPDTGYIESMSFDEARMLSFFGAKVLHPETILPAMKQDIPVHVRNTFKSGDRGTTITRLGDASAYGMRSVIARKPVSCIEVQTSQDEMESIRKKLLEELEQLTGMKPMISAVIDSTISLIYDISMHTIEEYVLHLDDSIDPAIREYALISGIGPNFRDTRSREAVAKFHEIINNMDASPILLSAIQKNTLSALVHPANAVEILKSLHHYCS
jgi:aspartate kinase